MSLWLALVWLVCAAICMAVFGFCRKHMADIAQQVAEEMENYINKILKAEREAEARLLEAFSNFDDRAEAIERYQKNMAETFACPQASQAWNWTRQDLELWRKEVESKQRANRSRSTVLAVVVIILAVNIAATATTVITLNSVKPILPASANPAASGAGASQLPPAVSMPPQALPLTNLPPLAPASPSIPADNGLDTTKQPPPGVDNTDPNGGDSLNEKAPGPNGRGSISDGTDALDKPKAFSNPNPTNHFSDDDSTFGMPKDDSRNVRAIPNSI